MTFHWYHVVQAGEVSSNESSHAQHSCIVWQHPIFQMPFCRSGAPSITHTHLARALNQARGRRADTSSTGSCMIGAKRPCAPLSTTLVAAALRVKTRRFRARRVSRPRAGKVCRVLLRSQWRRHATQTLVCARHNVTVPMSTPLGEFWAQDWQRIGVFILVFVTDQLPRSSSPGETGNHQQHHVFETS